jgi:hypothetical protein
MWPAESVYYRILSRNGGLANRVGNTPKTGANDETHAISGHVTELLLSPRPKTIPCRLILRAVGLRIPAPAESDEMSVDETPLSILHASLLPL